MRTATLALVFLFLVPEITLAQSAQDSWDNLKQLRVGQEIKVVDMNLKSLKGRFVNASDAAISLRTDEGERAIERASVMRVSAHGGKRGRNALIGLGIGAAIGVAAGVGVMERETGYAGAVAGTVVGLAAVGAGVGALFPGSRTIFRAPKR
jgi:hypothetical protein